MNKVSEIEKKMEKNLSENKQNSKSQKYNTLKHTFEDLLKLLQLNNSNNNIFNNLLQKLLIGYHEVVSSFSQENRELKILNANLNEQFKKMDKKLIESNNIINDKKKVIDLLNKKIATLTLESLKSEKNSLGTTNTNTNKTNKDIINDEQKIKIIINTNNNNINQNNNNNNNNINISNNIDDKEYKKIFNFNKNNLGDLDALYFFDKIHMNHNRSKSVLNIPYLPINKLNNNNNVVRNNIKMNNVNIKNKFDLIKQQFA